MAPGEEQVLHRFPQKGFDALWPTGNAARHGQGNQPMDQAPTSFHQIRDVDIVNLGAVVFVFMSLF
jgi:hypothetical protein